MAAFRRIKRRAARLAARARHQALAPRFGTFRNPGFFSPGLTAHGLLPPRYVRPIR